VLALQASPAKFQISTLGYYLVNLLILLVGRRNSKRVGAVFGLTPAKYQSGQNDRTGAISRCGDEMMRTMLYEAAQRDEKGDRGAFASAGRDHAPHVG
jgi:transposase